jgi:hypothetical protein
MSIKSRNDLKAEFVAGTAATESKFNDVFDSHYNKYEDSVLLGPIGQTGQNGLLGPTGPVFYNGLWYEYIGGSSGPSGATDSGKPGQIFANEDGLWVCIEPDNWIFLSATVAPGPTGSTGPAGPTGPSYYVSIAPTAPSSPGNIGEYSINGNGFFFHNGTNWLRVLGTGF